MAKVLQPLPIQRDERNNGFRPERTGKTELRSSNVRSILELQREFKARESVMRIDLNQGPQPSRRVTAGSAPNSAARGSSSASNARRRRRSGPAFRSSWPSASAGSPGIAASGGAPGTSPRLASGDSGRPVPAQPGQGSWGGVRVHDRRCWCLGTPPVGGIHHHWAAAIFRQICP